MRHGSLFSGLGGFDLAASWMGWENCFQVEKDPFCLKVLQEHFPSVPKHSDILNFNTEAYGHSVELISGGFPCQPYSVAGHRKGTEDDRHLWPAMLDAIRKISPRWVVAENVHGILSWNRGMVFEQVCADLETSGYQVQPVIIPAAAVDAPHIRNRVWVIAHSTAPGHGISPNQAQKETRLEPKKRKGLFRTPFEDGYAGDVANSHRHRLQRIRQPVGTHQKGRPHPGRHAAQPPRADWRNWPAQSPVCRRDDGLSFCLDGISFSSWRQKSIHALGNAIVPEVAYQIFRSIENWEKSSSNKPDPT